MSRLRKARGFTTVANETARNNQLSLKAKGLLLVLLSYPDDWEFLVDNVVADSADGRDATRGALKELEARHYLKRVRARNNSSQFDGWDWIISDLPMVDDEPSDGNLVKPSDGKPVSRENPRTGVSDDNIKKELTQKDINTYYSSNDDEYLSSEERAHRVMTGEGDTVAAVNRVRGILKRIYPDFLSKNEDRLESWSHYTPKRIWELHAASHPTNWLGTRNEGVNRLFIFRSLLDGEYLPPDEVPEQKPFETEAERMRRELRAEGLNV